MQEETVIKQGNWGRLVERTGDREDRFAVYDFQGFEVSDVTRKQANALVRKNKREYRNLTLEEVAFFDSLNA